MKIGIIKEYKNPPDKRVVFSPSMCLETKKKFPEIEFFVERSDIRCFTDSEYESIGVKVVSDLSDCEVLIGVKEVPIEKLIWGKKYFFFSHTIKKQPYNKKLLQQILKLKIDLFDHETIVDKSNNRLIGFGYYAGVIGAYNGFRAYGLKKNLFNIPKAIDLKDRVAIVTGGAQGFGLAITERFIDSGASVVIWDIDEKEIKKAINKIKSNKVSYQIVDVSDHDSIKKNLKETENKLKKIDIFINNAGITGPNVTLEKYPIDDWRKVIELNLNSVFYCCKEVVPYMLKNNYGRIVNIASIAGKEGNPNASAYSTSKAGVIGLTKSLGKELAENNIAVNCVTPAAAKTRIFDQMTQEHIDYMLSKIPRKKFAKVDELASLVTWLSCEENSFSTAAVFDLSGGRATY